MKIKVPEKEDEEKQEQIAKIQSEPNGDSRSISLVTDALTSPLSATSSPLPSQMPKT